MQGKRWYFRRFQGNGQSLPADVPGERKAPEGMPHSVPSQSRMPRQAEKPRDVLPQQQPVTDEAPAPMPKRWVLIAKRGLLGLIVTLALVFTYLFLLLGEPENTAAEVYPVREEAIHVPMAAMEAQDNVDLSVFTANFGKPVLALYSELPLFKASLYDTAFQGEYARRATITYVFADGQALILDSVRPTAAVALLEGSRGATLRLDSYYTFAGLDAARMDTDQTICVFGRTEDAVYAITCPFNHAADLSVLIRQTTLLQ